ncbi:6-bladed beta-propeller [Cecembia calidifontis]|uniref:6-bladed beta-propeller protein n=1 Tax=Cecembia calidifontis TaxID=1187080 RepID=A0A4Q7P7M9_9BACT|nr:6-bladed beta-propeller [Cecembia calidifontis]RZS95827.1 6-bladed beta-propeller protein [Cecembia calidifontis]
MKHITRVLFFIFIFQFQNCGIKEFPDSLQSTKTIEIKRDFLKGDSPEFIIEIIDTINLEVPGNPPLTSIQDLAFSQDFFVLLDRRQGLLKFENNGNFLGKIGGNGEGPDEYTMPYAIHLNEKENVVFVADWQKMTVISYNLEGEFNSASNKLPGHPISFYKDNDTLLVVQETLNGTKEKPRQVLISSIEPKTLEVENWERPLYGFHSDYTNIHPIPRIISRVGNVPLFYMPIIRGDISSHSDTDTIFRKQEGRLTPEYLLNFIGFDNTLQLGMRQVVMSNSHAFLRIVYDNTSYFIVIDLESNRPLIHLRKLFDQAMTDEMIPKPFKGNVYYSILRDKQNALEKNPLIVMYRLTFARN